MYRHEAVNFLLQEGADPNTCSLKKSAVTSMVQILWRFFKVRDRTGRSGAATQASEMTNLARRHGLDLDDERLTHVLLEEACRYPPSGDPHRARLSQQAQTLYRIFKTGPGVQWVATRAFKHMVMESRRNLTLIF